MAKSSNSLDGDISVLPMAKSSNSLDGDKGIKKST